MKKLNLNTIVILSLCIVGLYSCIKKTTVSPIPEISYKSFSPYIGDSADISVSFKDGDGDIGVGANDSTKTLWINYYYKDPITNQYQAFCYGCGTDSLKTSYIVRSPNDSYKGKPISGEIVVRLQQYRHSKTIKFIKYVIYLYDKAGNKSNVITTPELNGL